MRDWGGPPRDGCFVRRDPEIVPLVADGEVLVTFELADAYTQDVREAIASGLRTTFTYDVELRMPVAGWVDRTITTAVITTSSQVPTT